MTRILWDSDVLLTEQRDEKFDEYIFELDSYVPLCRFDEEAFETYHNDHVGTPHELTDDKENITWSGSYDIYGSIRGRYIGESDNRIRFQGQYADTEIGLHYNFFRYYDPELGRYINQDPVGLVGGLNQYEYTQNPLNWTDPLGLSGRGDQSGFAREAEESVSRSTGVPLNPQGPGQQTIPGSGPGGVRVPDLKVRGQEGSVRLRGTIVEVKASTGSTFGDLSHRSRQQIREAVDYARRLRSKAYLVKDPEVTNLLRNARVEIFTDLPAPTSGQFARLREQGL